MSDDVKVKPSPIQRNKLDVATELTTLYYSAYSMGDAEEIQETFAKFYAIAQYLETKRGNDLQSLVPEEIIKKIGR
ncbi:hypothetical protein KDJ56_07150 [Brevibacillus composti]|uniref:Uncharacterized protein n=1 Tax=Brevibacillus composti TaxID=2796470 RepID=A0A7T5JQ01_9BACL|nr:hypothetical protein [Brevibacillus composti]QQE75707.1 hypothetical protein JD108_07470 [Brevibacillus composti]QUO42733.1 hypothetical protein KDJ56_07150 [Brevibacillus composti]